MSLEDHFSTYYPEERLVTIHLLRVYFVLSSFLFLFLFFFFFQALSLGDAVCYQKTIFCGGRFRDRLGGAKARVISKFRGRMHSLEKITQF